MSERSRCCMPRIKSSIQSVNVGSDKQTEEAKDLNGRVEDYLNMTSGSLQSELIRKHRQMWPNIWHSATSLLGPFRLILEMYSSYII